MHLLAVLIGGIDSDPTPAQIDGTAARNEGNSGLFRFAGDIETYICNLLRLDEEIKKGVYAHESA